MIKRYKKSTIERVIELGFPHIKITENLYLIRNKTYEKAKISIWFLAKAKKNTI